MTTRTQQVERYDWVHPSWRDVVIEHLMRRPLERRRLLSRCGVSGLELGLSVSGGRYGERELPLLRSDDDWLALRRRALDLLPDMTFGEHGRLLSAAHSLLSGAEEGTERHHQVTLLAQEVLPAVVEIWNTWAKPLPARVLELFYETSVLVTPLCAGPQLGPSLTSCLSTLRKDWRPGLREDHERSLQFVLLAQRNEPRALRQSDWSDVRKRLVQLEKQASGVLDRALRLLAALEADEEEPDVEEAQSLSFDTFACRRMVALMRALDHQIASPPELEHGLAEVETAIDEWLAERQRETEDEAVHQADEDEDWEDDSHDPRAFTIAAVFADL